MQQLHEQLVVRPQLHPADAGVITSLIPTLSRGSGQEMKNSFLVGLWWTSPPLDGSHCLCFPPEGSSFPGPTFYSLSSAEAWTALIQLLGRTLESCTGAPTLWKWGYPLCLWGSHSRRQNRTGRAVSEVMARTELVFFLSPLIKNNFSLCSFFLLSAKCQECLRLTTTHVKEKQTPRNTGSITPSSAFCLFPSQTLFYALARHHQNSSCPFQLKSLETFVLQNTKGEGEETLSTQRAAFRTKQSHGLSAGLKNEGLGKV